MGVQFNLCLLLCSLVDLSTFLWTIYALAKKRSIHKTQCFSVEICYITSLARLKFWDMFKVVGSSTFCVGSQVVFAVYVYKVYVCAFSPFAYGSFKDGGIGATLLYVCNNICS